MRLDRLLTALALSTGSFLVATPAVAEDDFDPPQISLTSPFEGDQITRGSSLLFDYSCFDQVDPNPTCTATVTGDVTVPDPNPASGSTWDNVQPGNFTISVDAEDASGNQNSFSANFAVVEAMCNGQVVTVLRDLGEEPTAGPDVILASTNFFDPVDGLAGNDTICAGGTRTVIDGGPGNDRIIGGPQRDLLFGGTGNDRLEGRGGNDRIEGDEGTDTLLGGTEADRIEGGSGNDVVNGGPQSDSCHGQEGTRDTKAQCEVGTGFP